jgi:hypothetical protein
MSITDILRGPSNMSSNCKEVELPGVGMFKFIPIYIIRGENMRKWRRSAH